MPCDIRNACPDEVYVDVKGVLDVLLRGAAPPVVQEAADEPPAAADVPPAVADESKGLPEGSKVVFVLGGPGSGVYRILQPVAARSLLNDGHRASDCASSSPVLRTIAFQEQCCAHSSSRTSGMSTVQ